MPTVVQVPRLKKKIMMHMKPVNRVNGIILYSVVVLCLLTNKACLVIRGWRELLMNNRGLYRQTGSSKAGQGGDKSSAPLGLNIQRGKK